MDMSTSLQKHIHGPLYQQGRTLRQPAHHAHDLPCGIKGDLSPSGELLAQPFRRHAALVYQVEKRQLRGVAYLLLTLSGFLTLPGAAIF